MRKALYQNKRNEHKFMYVAHYVDGHYYTFQFMQFPNGVENRYCSGRRVTKTTMKSQTEDYNKMWEI